VTESQPDTAFALAHPDGRIAVAVAAHCTPVWRWRGPETPITAAGNFTKSIPGHRVGEAWWNKQTTQSSSPVLHTHEEELNAGVGAAAAGAYKLPRRSHPGGQVGSCKSAGVIRASGVRSRKAHGWHSICSGRTRSSFHPPSRNSRTVRGSRARLPAALFVPWSLLVVALKRSETSTRRPQPPWHSMAACVYFSSYLLDRFRTLRLRRPTWAAL